MNVSYLKVIIKSCNAFTWGIKKIDITLGLIARNKFAVKCFNSLKSNNYSVILDQFKQNINHNSYNIMEFNFNDLGTPI